MIDPKQEELAERRQTDLDEYLESFERSVRRRGNTEKYVRLLISRIRAVIEGCEFETLGDISADTVEYFLAKL